MAAPTRSHLNYKDYLANEVEIDAIDTGTGTIRHLHSLADWAGNEVVFATNATMSSVVQSLGSDGSSPPTLPGSATGVRGWLRGILAALSGILSVSDPQNAPFSRAVAMAPGGSPVAAGRSVEVQCTAYGNVAIVMAGGTTHIVPVNQGYNVFAYSAIGIDTNGTTATATYFNLY